MPDKFTGLIATTLFEIIPKLKPLPHGIPESPLNSGKPFDRFRYDWSVRLAVASTLIKPNRVCAGAFKVQPFLRGS